MRLLLRLYKGFVEVEYFVQAVGEALYEILFYEGEVGKRVSLIFDKPLEPVEQVSNNVDRGIDGLSGTLCHLVQLAVEQHL